ncbi:hypothetical protein F511_25744 [Dorcoceras hygrometricum]|uniref:Uncharacterized protein n=1 Tax=Dorcoceras hygrometricum TaxID=472368 RepID=A0A2Z7CBH8_9LAMI|nr:hypothetical protein F511_25744 [Dorcoceras hygrometricum]
MVGLIFGVNHLLLESCIVGELLNISGCSLCFVYSVCCRIDVQSQSSVEDVQAGKRLIKSDRSKPDQGFWSSWMLKRDGFIVEDEDEHGDEEEFESRILYPSWNSEGTPKLANRRYPSWYSEGTPQLAHQRTSKLVHYLRAKAEDHMLLDAVVEKDHKQYTQSKKRTVGKETSWEIKQEQLCTRADQHQSSSRVVQEQNI